jgi:hypothetical protein
MHKYRHRHNHSNSQRCHRNCCAIAVIASLAATHNATITAIIAPTNDVITAITEPPQSLHQRHHAPYRCTNS